MNWLAARTESVISGVEALFFLFLQAKILGFIWLDECILYKSDS